MNIDLGDINYLAVIVGVIISMVAGGAWYGAFAGPWTAEVGITREEVQAQPWSERWKPYGVAVVGAILLTLALALAVFIQAAGVTGVVDGLVVGLIGGHRVRGRRPGFQPRLRRQVAQALSDQRRVPGRTVRGSWHSSSRMAVGC